jgi:hypothetical protein
LPQQESPWEEIRINDWAEFDAEVGKLPRNRWLFRGHSDASWELDTSLYRAFEDARKVKKTAGNVKTFARDFHEELLINRFKQSAHLYLSPLPNEKEIFEWMAIMQHHGAPTRLLDVTLSPHIAAYFAMEAGHGDSAVFAFDHTALAPKDWDPVGDLMKRLVSGATKQDPSSNEPYIYRFFPRLNTHRLLAQQGAFLFPNNLGSSFTDLMRKRPGKGVACKKLVIPATLRLDGVHRLRTMNLTSTSLFPGIDGFCRSLRFQIFERVQDQKLLR